MSKVIYSCTITLFVAMECWNLFLFEETFKDSTWKPGCNCTLRITIKSITNQTDTMFLSSLFNQVISLKEFQISSINLSSSTSLQSRVTESLWGKKDTLLFLDLYFKWNQTIKFIRLLFGSLHRVFKNNFSKMNREFVTGRPS